MSELHDEMNAGDFGFTGKSRSIQLVRDSIERMKDVDSTVLILGESGTGKELVAQALHMRSTRVSHRFAAINCGAIPENLLESELFGYKKGAFTDAKSDRHGLFEVCSGGSLFLDEIADLPLNLQVKLLRVLQEREITPLGSSRSIKVDTRIIAATNRDIKQSIAARLFRHDLFFRLTILTIVLPPLRERREDIPLLIEEFIRRFNQRFGKAVAYPSHNVLMRLCAYNWPGNIRELQNTIERGVVLAEDSELQVGDLLGFDIPFTGLSTKHLPHRFEVKDEEVIGGNLSRENGDQPMTFFAESDLSGGDALKHGVGSIVPLTLAKEAFEAEYLTLLLEATGGNISEAARLAGRYRADMYDLLAKHKISPLGFRGG